MLLKNRSRPNPVLDADRQLKQQRILDAAMRVFGRVGYFQATVEQVAAEAGVAKGSIYNYFASKDQMLMAAYLAMIHRVQAEAARRSAGLSNLFQKLAAHADCWIRSIAGLGDSAAVVFDFYACCGPSCGDPRFREAKTRAYEQVAADLAGLFRQGLQEGLFEPPRCDPPAAARAAMALTEGLIIQWTLHNKSFDLVQEMLSQTYVFLNGMLTDRGRQLLGQTDLAAVLGLRGAG